MKIYEFVVVTVVFLIILAVLILGGQLNRLNDDPKFIKNEVINTTENDEDVIKELDWESELVQSLYPFTGAFPTVDLVYLPKMQNVDRENMTNEFILRMAFSKVTKEDWAPSYTSEGEPLEIDANILEGYIDDIFGEVNFKHKNFDNKDLSINGSETFTYENEYDEENDLYTINHLAGDGMGESYMLEHTLIARQIGNKIELIIKPIYIENIGQKENKDGEYYFYYKCYSSYDLKTEKFSGLLTNEIEGTLYDDYSEFIDEIKNIDIDKLETYTLTYKLNEKTNKYEFESLKFQR